MAQLFSNVQHYTYCASFCKTLNLIFWWVSIAFVYCSFLFADHPQNIIQQQIKRLEHYRFFLTEKLKTPFAIDKIPCEKMHVHLGEFTPHLPLVRNHLIYRGMIKNAKTTDEYVYDEELMQAIKSMQKNHMQEETGVLDEQICRILNTPLSNDFHLIDQSLKKLKRIQEKCVHEKKILFINVAHYKLFAFTDGQVDFTMNVVVGRFDRQTPLLEDRIASLVLSPTWTIPKTILVQDKIKKFENNPHILEKQKFRVYDLNGEELSVHQIDWRHVKMNPTLYRFEQAPGAGNALGGVKFILEKKSDIRLHGTNVKGTFKKNKRAVSSGCVRLEDPEKVAQWLLKDYKKSVCRLDADCIADFVKTKSKKQSSYTFKLNRNVSVLIDYVPLWIQDDGSILRHDPYKMFLLS
ncbi:MAG: hypothetical protein CNLJKLNK_00153 [Holosporales bacterium]